MKRTFFAGGLLGVFALCGSVTMMSCLLPLGFDPEGPTRFPMITTDSTMIPDLASPDNGAIDVALHTYDSSSQTPILTWRPVSGAARYRAVLSLDLRFGTTIIDDSTLTDADTSKLITASLSYNTTYYWTVCAKSESGKRGWSSIWRFTTKIDPLPALQNEFVAQRFGMFIHFGMSTFTRYLYPTTSGEWELGDEDENLFHPDSLNLGQWADAAKAAQCRYVILTVKHHGGYCLWPSKGQWSLKPHSIEQSSWYQQHGQRDIVREFVDSVRSRGMEPGFYYSIRDETNPPTVFMVKDQLTELLSNYGDIKMIRFDGWGWYTGYYQIPYDTVAELVHKLNDSLGHHTIIAENNHQHQLYHSEIVWYEIPLDYMPPAGNMLPSGGSEPFRLDNCWFWHPLNCTLKSTQSVIDRIVAAKAAHMIYFINLTPDTTGLLPADQVQAMHEIGEAAAAQGVLKP